ncbi:GmrSD restriction endonuclease domain-containing protein [Helicobacter sp. T3_23-1059]
MNATINLKDFLNKYNVEAPMLQRDYAQGRKSQENIANEFLDAIFAVLKGKRDTLHIDFIYGYKEGEKFILIDGQQRITTLWLLHFYLYKKTGRLESIAKELSNFSYAVRNSSKKFCKNLLNKDFDLNTNPSKTIIDKGGEFEKEENLRSDPTIKAMLNMLDLIYARLDNKTNLDLLIKNLDNITFYAFDMDEFALGEELYIKMNARGKQLTRYENLKAYIEQDSQIADSHALLANIDNKWADMFFADCDFNAFDKRGIVFLHYANVFFMLLQGKVKSGEIKAMIDSANHPIDDFYQPLKNIENMALLDRLMDLYKDCSEIFKQSGFDKFSNFDSFKNARDSLGYVEICYFFSALFFVLESKNDTNINTQSLEDYLRVCKHLIENHRLDKPDEHIIAFFNLFKTLSKGYKNIYEFLVQNHTHNFHSNIYALESRKAKLILQSRKGSDKWEEILNATSNHNILRGWVDYLLDFSDEKFKYQSWWNYAIFSEILNETSEESILDYNNPKSNPDFEKFSKYANLTMQIFDEIQQDKVQNNGFLPLFQRAFLSVGDFGFSTTNYFYGNYCGEIYRDREAWNWLLSGKNNESEMPYFKKLLGEIAESKKTNLREILQDIVDNADISSRKWWEQLLIRQEGLFEFLVENKQTFQKTRRIYFDDYNEQVILLNKTRVSYNQVGARDLLTYGFYCYCKQKGISVSEYENSAIIYDYEQDDEIKPNFSINNKGIIIAIVDDKGIIVYDTQEFFIDIKGDIFAEFDKVLDEIFRKV